MCDELVAEVRKKVIFIRHAESQNNVAKQDAAATWLACKTFTGWPSLKQIGSIASMITIPMNTDLSDAGEKMAGNLRHQMNQTDFISNHGVELIVHSPLIRAQRTCSILFEHTGVPIVENEFIFEKNISEHFRFADMNRRVTQFIEWLRARPECVIVVVGHSAFFRSLLQLKKDMKMKNCEVCCSYLEPLSSSTYSISPTPQDNSNNTVSSAAADISSAFVGVETLIEGGAALLLPHYKSIVSVPSPAITTE